MSQSVCHCVCLELVSFHISFNCITYIKMIKLLFIFTAVFPILYSLILGYYISFFLLSKLSSVIYEYFVDNFQVNRLLKVKYAT